MEKLRHGHWACIAELPLTMKEVKSHFTFYHIILLRTQACNKPMIPDDGLIHAPAVALINHLIWILESAVDVDEYDQCHYFQGASLFIQGIISLQEQNAVVGDTMWKQTAEHCHAFYATTMQLLHDLEAILHLWFLMTPPPTCVGNRCNKE
jgi:hypothetical protein